MTPEERAEKRIAQIRVLLESWLDYLPSPPGSRFGQLPPPPGDVMVRESVRPSVSESHAAELKRLHRLNEAALHRLSGELDSDGPDPERVFRAKQAQYRRGSYADLDRAMRRLQSGRPYQYAILVAVYVNGFTTYTSPTVLDSAITALSDYLPAQLRAPLMRDRGHEQTAEVVRRLAALHPSWPQRKLALSAGTSQATVSRVLAA